jgi:RecB family exonuclease
MCNACSDKGKIKLDYIRRSHIELYKDCPYAFKMEVIDQIPTSQSIYAKLGSFIHDEFEQYQRGNRTLEQILENSLSAIDSWDDEFGEEIREKMKVRTEASVLGFEEVIPTLKNEIVALEETIFFELDSELPKVRITMDRVDKDQEGNLHLHDWKTGKVMTGKKLTTDLQVPLYIYAIRSHYGITPKSFTLYYVSEGKTRTYNMVDEDTFVCTVRKKDYTISITETLREVKSIFAKIKNGHFSIPEKPNFFACKMCEFKAMGKCAGHENESWSQINMARGV